MVRWLLFPVLFFSTFASSKQAMSPAQQARILAEGRVLYANQVWALETLIRSRFSLFLVQGRDYINEGQRLGDLALKDLDREIKNYRASFENRAADSTSPTFDDGTRFVQLIRKYYLEPTAPKPADADWAPLLSAKLQDLESAQAAYREVSGSSLVGTWYERPYNLNYLGATRLPLNHSNAQEITAHSFLISNALWMEVALLASTIGPTQGLERLADMLGTLARQISYVHMSLSYREWYQRLPVKRTFETDFSSYVRNSRELYSQTRSQVVDLCQHLNKAPVEEIKAISKNLARLLEDLDGALYQLSQAQVPNPKDLPALSAPVSPETSAEYSEMFYYIPSRPQTPEAGNSTPLPPPPANSGNSPSEILPPPPPEILPPPTPKLQEGPALKPPIDPLKLPEPEPTKLGPVAWIRAKTG